MTDIAALRDSLVFPLLVKPRLSHIFEERFGRKFVVVESIDELLRAFALVSQESQRSFRQNWTGATVLR